MVALNPDVEYKPRSRLPANLDRNQRQDNPAFLVTQSSLPPGTRFVALAIVTRLRRDNPRLWASRATVASWTGFGLSTVAKHMKRLRKIGFLVRIGQRDTGTVEYEVHVEALPRRDASKRPPDPRARTYRSQRHRATTETTTTASTTDVRSYLIEIGHKNPDLLLHHVGEAKVAEAAEVVRAKVEAGTVLASKAAAYLMGIVKNTAGIPWRQYEQHRRTRARRPGRKDPETSVGQVLVNVLPGEVSRNGTPPYPETGPNKQPSDQGLVPEAEVLKEKSVPTSEAEEEIARIVRQRGGRLASDDHGRSVGETGLAGSP